MAWPPGIFVGGLNIWKQYCGISYLAKRRGVVGKKMAFSKKKNYWLTQYIFGPQAVARELSFAILQPVKAIETITPQTELFHVSTKHKVSGINWIISLLCIRRGETGFILLNLTDKPFGKWDRGEESINSFKEVASRELFSTFVKWDIWEGILRPESRPILKEFRSIKLYES